MLSHFMHGEIRKILYAEYRMTSRFTLSEYSDIDFPSLARTRGYAIYEEKRRGHECQLKIIPEDSPILTFICYLITWTLAHDDGLISDFLYGGGLTITGHCARSNLLRTRSR